MTSIVVDPERETPATDQSKTDGAPATENAPAPEDTLPEKYRGKSVVDVIEMHRQAESELGRARNEIGSVRKLADELIGIRRAELQATAKPTENVQPITANDLLDRPEESVATIARRVAEERMSEVAARTQSLEAELATTRFEKKHPGFQQTMTKPEFAEFVRGSEYRQRLAMNASRGDFVAADELFSLYNERETFRQQAPAQQSSDSGVSAARKATTVRSGGSSAAGVVPGNDGKARFTRAELLNMRINKPEEFDMRQAEILEAYREGRVR